MAKPHHKISKKRGLEPGSVIYIGEKRTEKVKITVIDYNATEHWEKELTDIEACFPYKDTPTVTWINICGLHEVTVLEKIGRHFDLHPLTLEDIANTGHRPKMELTDNYIFIILKMLYHNADTGQLVIEQVSVVCGRNYVITFQEKEGDVFDPVRERIKKTRPRVRFMNPDYLAYALVDAVVDGYYLVMENLGEKIEHIEDMMVNNPVPENLEVIHELKRKLVNMRRAVWPLREVIGGMERLETPLFHETTRIYLRDLYEHAVQIIDTVDTFRDMVSGLLDIYLSSVSNKMNEVMKVLTIIATIFIPLGFLAGVYGMNFDPSAGPFNMPELGFPYGYILFWGVALLIGGGLLFYFKRKRWI